MSRAGSDRGIRDDRRGFHHRDIDDRGLRQLDPLPGVPLLDLLDFAGVVRRRAR
jgi:hypothetical protein